MPRSLGYDAQKVVELYHSLRSISRVAAKLGCCAKTVVNYLERAGQKRIYAAGPRPHVHPANKLNLDEQAVVKMYLKVRSMYKVADHFGCSTPPLSSILKKHGITPDGKTPAMPGDKNPNWQGGVSRLPYPPDWTETLKESIRQRDGHKCCLCGTEQAGADGRTFAVHHIDYDKENLDPSNLITLCTVCHSKTNHLVARKRRQWVRFFSTMLARSSA